MEEILNIEATKDSPSILLDGKHVQLKIFGTSFPANAIKVYGQVFDWLDEIKIPAGKTLVCDFYYNYLNSSSKSAVYEILKKLERLHQQGNGVSITWSYDQFDDDMLELGEEFAEMVPLIFVLKAIE